MSLLKKIIPKPLKEWLKYKKYNKQYQKYQLNCNKIGCKECILFGTPLHGNLGDHAIAYAELKLLHKMGFEVFEVPTYRKQYYLSYIAKHISKDALICITGGGSMGSQWMVEEWMIREVVQTFGDNKIIIFPQTIFYQEDERGKKEFQLSMDIYNAHPNIAICAREEKSYQMMKKSYPNANILLVPDIVLSLDHIQTHNQREGILLCLRHDVEANLKETEKKIIIQAVKETNIPYSWTDTVIKEDIEKEQRETYLNQKLNEFSNAKLVITDRLHGMIFAILTKTPCIVMGNYNHKVKGVYQWIQELPYVFYVEEVDTIKDNISKMLEIDAIQDKNIKDTFHILQEIISDNK